MFLFRHMFPQVPAFFYTTTPVYKICLLLFNGTMGAVALTRRMTMRRLLIGLFLSISGLSSPALAQDVRVLGKERVVYTLFLIEPADMTPLIFRAQLARPSLPNNVGQIPPVHLRIYRQGEHMRTALAVPARQRLQFSLNRT
jgi:hypothetical protein